MDKSAIPEWLLNSQGPLPPLTTGASHKSRRRNFVEKTIGDISRFMSEEFFAEQIAASAGLLQEIHPGAKVVGTLLLIGIAISIRHWLILLLLNFWVLLLVHLSAIRVQTFLKRVWLVVPLFTGVIIFPSLFNYVLPGTPLLVLLRFDQNPHLGPWTFPAVLAITRQGALGALVFILRVGACVSLALLTTLTTRWPALLKAFRMIYVPQIFVTVLEMAYRYIFVLLLSLTDMFMARKSRTVGRTSTKEQRRFISGAMGNLWERAFNLSEEVHAAMLARGYNGQPQTLTRFKMHTLDWLWAGFMVLISLLLLWGDWLVGYR